MAAPKPTPTVTSVSCPDGTISISPNTGDVNISLFNKAQAGTYSFPYQISIDAKGSVLDIKTMDQMVESVGTLDGLTSTGGKDPVLSLVPTGVLPPGKTGSTMTIGALASIDYNQYGQLTAVRAGAAVCGVVPVHNGMSSPIYIGGGFGSQSLVTLTYKGTVTSPSFLSYETFDRTDQMESHFIIYTSDPQTIGNVSWELIYI